MYHQAPTAITSTTAANAAICMPWRELLDPLSRVLFSSSSGSELPNFGRGNSGMRSEEHTSELQSHLNLVCRLLLEKKQPQSQRAADTYRHENNRCRELTDL